MGISWQPSDGIELSLDYWDIIQEDKIDEAVGFVYQQECGNQASTICVRDTPLPGDTLGALQSIAATFDNIAEQSATGLDLEANFSWGLGGGTMSLGLIYTHLLDFERVELSPAGSLITRDATGEYEYPEDRAQLSGDWGTDAWGIFAAINYIGEFQDLPDANFDTVPDYDTNDTREVSAFTTLNLQFRFTGIENVKLLLSLDNALDEEPPFAVGDGNNDLYGYVQSQHNPRGRFWAAKAIFNF